MQIEIEKITVNYVCLNCKHVLKNVPLWDIFEVLNPICPECDTEMSIRGKCVTVKG